MSDPHTFARGRRRLCFALLLSVFLVGCQRSSRSGGGAWPGPEDDTPPEFAMVEKAGAGATEENPQALVGDVFEDYDYAFQLTRPNADWQFG